MAQYDINLREYWRIIRKRKLFLVLITILLTFFSLALAIVRAPSPLYEATCSIKFEKSISALGLYSQFFSLGSGSEIETQMAIIKSYPVFKKVGIALGLIVGDEREFDSRFGHIVTNLQSQITVSREGYSNIVNIIAKSATPDFAASLANQVALAYKEIRSAEVSQRTDEAIKFIKGQLEDVGGRLSKSEGRLRKYREDKNIIDLSSQSSNLLSKVDSLESRLAQIVEAEKELKNVIKNIKMDLADTLGTKDSFSTEQASALYQKLHSRFIDLLIERDRLLVQYTSSHPQVIEINGQIDEVKQKMIMELGSQIEIQAKKKEELIKEIRGLRDNIRTLPAKGLELSRLEREVERTGEIYSLLESKYQEALIQNAEKPEEVALVRPAFETLNPINPPNTVPSALMGALIGIVFGIVFAFIIETFDTSLGAIDEVEQTLGLKVLGLIPYIDIKDVQEDLKDKYNQDDATVGTARLIPNFGPQSILAESFRSLRMNIQFSAMKQNIKSIVMTSAVAEEGKTTVAANLAIAMAQGGFRTLLMGADLRRPTIYKIFGLDPYPGITDILLSNYDFSDTVKTVTDIMMGKMNMDRIMLTPGIDNLHIITCGTMTTNPAELMQSEKFKDLLKKIRDQYDLILLDAPPLISAADALILANETDGVLLTYRVGKVARGILKRVKVQLEQVKANIIGVVLNGVKAEISPDFEELKRYKYYSYYGVDDKKKKVKKKRDIKSLVRLILIIAAFCLLIVGFLWQSGVIDTDRYMPREDKALTESEENNISSPPKGIVTTEKIDMPEPEVSTVPLPASTHYPYSIMTASLKSLQHVNEAKAISLLKAKGLMPYYTSVNLGEKGDWFRVCVGHFETLGEAKNFQERFGLKDSKIIETTYTNEIGYFSSADKMKEKIISIKKSGYLPYIIEEPERGYRLLVGAYVTKEGADEMASMLKEVGIESKVVLR